MVTIIAGGGTGGHFFPAISLVDYFLEKNENVLYVGSKNGIENSLSHLIKSPYVLLDTKGFVGKDYKQKLETLIGILRESFNLNKALKSEFRVIIFGGYASFSPAFLSLLKRKKLYIHEQNSIPSLVNRVFYPFCEKSFITFNYSRKFFKNDKKVVLSSLPVRKEFFNFEEKNFKEINITFLGGSQGARYLNEIAPLFFKKTGLSGFHITGKKDFDRTKELYEKENIKNVELISFTENIKDVLSKTTLAISRAGASTAIELSLSKTPAIFIPFRYAAKNHQYFNAKEIESLGGAFVIEEKDLTLEILIKNVYKALDNITSMANNIYLFAPKELPQKIIYENVITSS